MGLSFSQKDDKNASVTQRYFSIDKSAMTKDGTHIYCKVMYDQENFSPSYIVKIETSTSLLLDRFFLNENFVDKMIVSDDDSYLAIQARKNFYVFDLQTKIPVVVLEIASFWFFFKEDLIFFRQAKNSFACCALKTFECQSFLQFDSKTEKISFLCATENLKYCFYLAILKEKSSNRIVKYDLEKSQVVHCYKSARDIKFMFWVECSKVLVTGKYCDSLSIYTTENEVKNIKNLKSYGLLRAAKQIESSNKICAFYECDLHSNICIWNLESLTLERKIEVKIEKCCTYFEILHVNSSSVFIQSDIEVLKCELEKSFIEEEQFDYSMKKMVQILNSKKLQRMITQNTTELKLKEAQSCGRFNLEDMDEHRSFSAVSNDWKQISFGFDRKNVRMPKMISNVSDFPDSNIEGEITKINFKTENIDSRNYFSRLTEDFKENELINRELSLDKESSSGKKKRNIRSDFRKTFVKNSEMNWKLYSTAKQGLLKKKEMTNSEKDNDNVTVKLERNSQG